MFIVCKRRRDGSLIAGTPPKVHTEYAEAVGEAERLAGSIDDADAFVVFRAHSVSRRVCAPVETVLVEHH